MKDPRSSEITPEALFQKRREFLKSASAFVATAAGVGVGLTWLTARRGGARSRTAVLAADAGTQLAHSGSEFQLTDSPTPLRDFSTYNNFYEFGLDKGDPVDRAQSLRTKPWTVDVGGLAQNPRSFDVDELMKRFTLEERVYRFRCVEGWSMVIPWLGFPLSLLLKEVEPLGTATYVEFETLLDTEQMPGQRAATLQWPYTEGLRIDEAMHPLTLVTMGAYGKPLLNQNGAPLRLVVPWKYGYKGAKSLVRITLTDREPKTTWNIAAPDEYGFYSNVNPEVAHPRWSQATERRIGELARRKTLMFNGYAEQVASLYAGLDLVKNH